MRYIIAIILFLFPLFTHAETRFKSPYFYSDITFTKAGSPYIIDGDMTVDTGRTFTIEKGVTVLAATTTTLSYKPFITILGNIKIMGSESEPVTINGFSRILLRGKNNQIEHGSFKNSPLNITKLNSDPRATTTITSSSFTQSPTALELQGGDIYIENSEIHDNGTGIISNSQANWNSVVIKNSFLEQNQKDIVNGFIKQMNAKENWWGRAEGPGQTISGPVETTPWLSSDPRKKILCCSNVLFIPGLQASRLYRDDVDLLGGGTTTRRAWEPYTNNDIRSLFLAPNGESLNHTIFPKDIIEAAYGTKGIYKKFVATMDGVVADGTIKEWRAYPYDWRMSVNDLVNDNLFREIERLASTSKTGKVTVIAHSNGGLIAKMLGKKLEERGKSALLGRVLLVAVPQLGTPHAIAGMLHGDSQDILGGLVASKSTMRSLGQNMLGAYGLLPSEEFFTRVTAPVITFLGNAVGSYDNFANYITDKNRFVKEDDMKTAAVLSPSLLVNAQSIHRTIDSWAYPTTTELLAIAGWGVPTTQTVEYASGTVKMKKTLAGDGTVVTPSALNSSGQNLYFNQGLYNFDQHLGTNHTDIFETGVITNFISKIIATTSLVGHNMYSPYLSTTNPENAPWNNWLTFSVHSPVDMDVYDDKGNHMGLIPIPGSRDSDLKWFENTIGGEYDFVGDEKYYTVPADGTYTIQLQGNGIGMFTFQVEKYLGTEMIEVANVSYTDLPVTPLLEANISIASNAMSPEINLDIDGDGFVDLKTGPSPKLDPIIHLDALRILTTTLSLDKNEEKQFIKRIERIRSLITDEKSEQSIKKIKDITEKVDLGHWKLKDLTLDNKTLLTAMLDTLLLSLETAN
jgi:pimeloyl-ACP methyl ester carboxylesterase